jgi:uncharacterized protein with von Willebrand factor type A (vWA) domain
MSSAPADGAAFAGNLVRFGQLLRRLGLSVDPEQTRLLAGVLPRLGLDRRADVKAAARSVYVRRNEDRALFDAAFDAFWRRGTVTGVPVGSLPRLRQQGGAQAAAGGLAADASAVTALARAAHGASTRDVLRTADFAELTPAEARDAEAMIAALRPAAPHRPSRRHRIARHGRRLAPRAMLRGSLGTGGEALDWRWLERRTRARPIVLVCDISGSMSAYSRLLLRFAHALGRTGSPTEVFVFGTRLTRLTRELRHRDAPAALRRVAGRVVDWHGGTRIGAALRELNRRWLRRTIRSGAVVLVVSDGWERDDPAVLADAMATLQRSCHRLVWLNPLAGRPGFVPLTAGLQVALPYVDDFLPCASVASLEALAARLATLSHGRPDRPARGRWLAVEPRPRAG